MRNLSLYLACCIFLALSCKTLHKSDETSSVASTDSKDSNALVASAPTVQEKEKVLVRPDEEHEGQFVITYISRRPTAQEYFDFLNKTDDPTKQLFVQIAELGTIEKTIEFLKMDLNSEIGLTWSNEAELAVLADKYNR